MTTLLEAPCAPAGSVGTPEDPHRIEIALLRRSAGKATYRVTFSGAPLVDSHTPERAACRELVRLGFTGVLRTRWVGAAHDALIIHDIEAAAQWNISETQSSGPRLVRFSEFDRGRADAPEDHSGIDEQPRIDEYKPSIEIQT